jgi:dolichol-phosphate mannosyltransferase
MTANEFTYRIRAAARRPASWMQLLRFGIVGASGYIINLGVFALLADTLEVHHVLAAIGAFCVAVTNNFVWNRYWTFEPGEGHPAFQAARFFAVSVAALVINIVVLQVLIAGAGMQDLGAQAIAVAVAMPFNFLGNKLWTFA